MTADSPMVSHVKSLRKSILDLREFGGATGSSAPPYQGYLGSHTNATMQLLAMCIARSGVAKIEFQESLTEDQWVALIIMVHRAYLAGLVTALEAICAGYCEARGQAISAARAGRGPDFMDYINSALRLSKVTSDQCTYWRRRFEGLRILRNKCSHYDTNLTSQEETYLRDAELAHHIGVDGRVQLRWTDYPSLAQRTLDFAREIEAA